MSFLVCDKCGSYYELQPGEFPEDFIDECECGGKLEFVESIDDPSFENINSKRESLVARVLNIPNDSVLYPKHNLSFDIGVLLSLMGLVGFLILIVDISQTNLIFIPSILLLAAGAPFLSYSYGFNWILLINIK